MFIPHLVPYPCNLTIPGHLGYFNYLMLAGTLCGVEMGLAMAGVPISRTGVTAALEYLSDAQPATQSGGRVAVTT